jgi:hypothetical protein
MNDVLAAVTATFPNASLVQVVPEPGPALFFLAGGILFSLQRSKKAR